MASLAAGVPGCCLGCGLGEQLCRMRSQVSLALALGSLYHAAGALSGQQDPAMPHKQPAAGLLCTSILVLSMHGASTAVVLPSVLAVQAVCSCAR